MLFSPEGWRCNPRVCSADASILYATLSEEDSGPKLLRDATISLASSKTLFLVFIIQKSDNLPQICFIES